MEMAKQAWESVSCVTLKNCWENTGIQPLRPPKITLRHPCPPMPPNRAAPDALGNQSAPDTPSKLCEVATIPNEYSKLREKLLYLLAQLKERGHISQPRTLDELLDPEEEREIGENDDPFEGGDVEIVGMVQEEMSLARGDVTETDFDGDPDIEETDLDDCPEVVPQSLEERPEMCRIAEENSMVAGTEVALEVGKSLR